MGNYKVDKFSVAFIVMVCLTTAGCKDKKLSGGGPPYYTTAFQCEQKDSESGWCFATPSRIFSSAYQFVGEGAVQDFIVSNGKMCVANKEGCINVYVDIKDRQ